MDSINIASMSKELDALTEQFRQQRTQLEENLKATKQEVTVLSSQIRDHEQEVLSKQGSYCVCSADHL
jgi:hypothetical protein